MSAQDLQEYLNLRPNTQEYVSRWIPFMHQSCDPGRCTCWERTMSLGRRRELDISKGAPDLDRKTDAEVWRRAFELHRIEHGGGPITPPWASGTGSCSCFSRACDEIIVSGSIEHIYGEPDILEQYREREI